MWISLSSLKFFLLMEDWSFVFFLESWQRMRESMFLFLELIWRRKWQPTPGFLPGESHGQRSLVGYSAWVRKELDMTEWLHFHFFHFLELKRGGPLWTAKAGRALGFCGYIVPVKNTWMWFGSTPGSMYFCTPLPVENLRQNRVKQFPSVPQ